jgi:hypothetical protein
MLPFLKPKQVAGVILSKRKSDGQTEVEGTAGDEDQALMSCAGDLIRAVHAKDEQAVCSALRSAFQVLESEEEPSEGLEQEPSEDQE